MPYASLGDFLVRAPLYQDVTFTDFPSRMHGNGTYYVKTPPVIDRECVDCGATKWEFAGDWGSEPTERSLHQARYRCRNCGGRVFDVWFWWWRGGGGATFSKIGQYPKLEIPIPKEFGEALGDKRPLYVKGMTLRHNAYGIGALTYFRRVIEDTTDEMLNLLEEAMQATGADPEALAALQRAKDGTQFEDKVRIAAEVLPANLRPNNINPFGDLYKLLSIGLHDRNDEECCEIVDAMDESLKFIYTQLKTHMEANKGYEGSTQKVSDLLAKMKKKDGG